MVASALQAGGFPFNFPFFNPFPVAPLCTPGWTVNPWRPPAQVQTICTLVRMYMHVPPAQLP